MTMAGVCKEGKLQTSRFSPGTGSVIKHKENPIVWVCVAMNMSHCQ